MYTLPARFDPSLYVLALQGVWEQDDRNMVFRRVPLTTVRCSSNPTVVLHLLAPSQPESQLRSTKPEPIVTCGCTGKLPGMKYSSVSLSLGEAFRKMSWRFSMHPGHPLVSPGCPSTVLHPVVNFEVHLELDVMGFSSSWLSHLPYESLNQPRLRA